MLDLKAISLIVSVFSHEQSGFNSHPPPSPRKTPYLSYVLIISKNKAAK